MTKIYEAICLLRNSREKGLQIVLRNPNKLIISQNNLKIFNSAFPDNPKIENIIYSTSYGQNLCYIWSFSYENEQNSIFIVSKRSLTTEFLKLLRDSQLKLNNKTPEDIFRIILECLKKWNFENGKILNAITPSCSYKISVNPNFITLSAFDPKLWLKKKLPIKNIWKALISNKNILVYGESPDRVSFAVFSLMSIISPLKYFENFLPYTRKGDPRYNEILQGEKKWRIVGTTDRELLTKCKQFDFMAVLPRISKRKTLTIDSILSTENATVDKEIKTLTSELLLKLMDQFDLMLMEDPYFDILGQKFTQQKMEKIISQKDINFPLSVNDFLLFQESQTFKEWRKTIIFRETFRDAFLSFDPHETLEKRTYDELLKIKAIIPRMQQVFQKDLHMTCVIKGHQHIISTLLKNQKSVR